LHFFQFKSRREIGPAFSCPGPAFSVDPGRGLKLVAGYHHGDTIRRTLYDWCISRLLTGCEHGLQRSYYDNSGLAVTRTFDLLQSKSDQFIIVPKHTDVVNLTKFSQAVYKGKGNGKRGFV